MTQLATQLPLVTTLLADAGYTLDDQQPHTMGERFLMQNITTASGQKIILLGHNAHDVRVVIKVALDDAGAAELKHEQSCRNLLSNINFAYEKFYAPVEVAFWTDGPYTISVQEYIQQDQAFTQRPVADQFNYALSAFKTQECARATTESHFKTIARTFGVRTSTNYQAFTKKFLATANELTSDGTLLQTLLETQVYLEKNLTRIEQYCGFLTHTDFVPHNFRIADGKLYLLDCASLEFGNKHESWARFLNFMTLYNHELENQLITYVEKNRAPEERESLQLMRLYRLAEIITYYLGRLPASSGDLLTLNQARVDFWHDVLSAERINQRVSRTIVENYCTTRDRLRSAGENIRQQGLH